MAGTKKKIYELTAHTSIVDTDVLPISATASGSAEKSTASEVKAYVKSGLTTADVAASTNKNYVTDAQATVIGNTSGTNTGDQDLSSYVTKTGAETITNKTFDDATTHTQVTTPSNPVSGKNKLYFKSDDKLYKLTSAGTETEIGTGGSGTGDVIGPATNTDNKIPQWNGANSKTLKDGLGLVTTLGSPGADTNVPTEAAVRAAISSAGGGDVSGPASSVDNEIALFSGLSGKTLKNSSKTIVTTLGSDDTTVPTSKAVKDVTDGLITKATFDANTILKADTDNTPSAVTIAEQKVVGRITGGQIGALDIDSDLSSVSLNDDTIPSAKATKAYADTKLTNSIATNKLLGRGTAGTGVIEEITLGTNLSLSGTTLNATGGSGTSYWTDVPGTPTRLGVNSFSVTDTSNANKYDLLLQRGTVLKWTDSGNTKQAMVMGATYSTNAVTVVLAGDTLNAGFTDMKYGLEKAREYKFSLAGTIGAVGTNVANTVLVDMPIKVFGCIMWAGTAGNGTTTIDINKNGTSMFTNKPSITTTDQYGVGIADDGTTATTINYLTLDVDAVASTTKIVDLYVNLHYTPLNNIYLS